MRVMISGGGIAGLTLAYWLQRNHQVLLLERGPSLRAAGCMLDLFGSGYDVAEKMGLLPEFSSLQYQFHRLLFLGSAGQQLASIQGDQLRELFDSRHVTLMREDLIRALYSRIEAKAEIRFGTAIETLQQDERKVRARLSGGVMEDVDLLVGTEGVHSPVRRAFFGPPERCVRFMGYRVASILLDKMPTELNANTIYTLTNPRRQVSLYPLRGGSLFARFVYMAAPRVVGATLDEARAELIESFGGVGWVVPRLLAWLNEAELSIEDASQVELPRWSSGRVALVGDSLQDASLYGASMAMTGAYVLAEEIGASHSLEGSLLRYEQRLRPTIQALQLTKQKLSPLLLPSGSLPLALRNSLLRIFPRYLINRYLIKRDNLVQ